MGRPYEGGIFLFGKKYGACTAMLKAMLSETTKAKGDAVEEIYARLVALAGRMMRAGLKIPRCTVDNEIDEDLATALLRVAPTANIWRGTGPAVERETIKKLLALISVSSALTHYARRQKMTELSHEDARLTIVFSHGEVLAFICYRLDVSHRGYASLVGYTYELHVHKSLQRQRIGSTLLEEAESEMFAGGCKNALLTVRSNNSAKDGFYSGCGYSYSPLSPATGVNTIMSKVLSPKIPPPSGETEVKEVHLAAINKAALSCLCSDRGAAEAGLPEHLKGPKLAAYKLLIGRRLIYYSYPFAEGRRIRTKLDPLSLDAGSLVAKEVVIDDLTTLSKAPPETTLKPGDCVRVAQDGEYISGQKWQYGIVRYVHCKLLVDINYDGGLETSRGLPAYAHEIQRVNRRNAS
jgi:ribosomal protein S18 acetylase RimI-like enzyme